MTPRMYRVGIIACFLVFTACSGATEDDGNNSIITNAGTSSNGSMNAGTNAGTNAAPGLEGLVINEVAAAGDPDDWAELYNGSSDPIDLTGVTYTDDIAGDPARATFADGTTVEPGGYLVIDFVDPDPGFGLGGDEEFGIFSAAGVLIDSVDWDEGDSPEGASFGRFPNGTGSFKTLATPTRGAANVDGDGETCGDGTVDAGEVCDGTALDGATCADRGFSGGQLACSADCQVFDTTACTGAPSSDVRLNEISAKGDDVIELVNTGSAAVDLDGWYVADEGYDPQDPAGTAGQRYDFPAGTTLEPGAYLALIKDTDHTFGVGGDDSIFLYRTDGTIADQTSWTDPDAEVSWCRLPDATGDFQSCPFSTFGAMNRASAVVINEVTSKGDDNIELANLSDRAIDLEGWYVADSGWDPADEAGTADQRYVFPAGTMLPASGYLNLVKDTDHTFGLGGEDAVFIYDAGDELIDETSWADGEADVSWCRKPNLTGPFVVCDNGTFGAANE